MTLQIRHIIKHVLTIICLITICNVHANPGSVNNFKVNDSTVTTGTTVSLTWSSTSGATYYNLYALKPGFSYYTRFRSNLTSTSTTRLIGVDGKHVIKIEACDIDRCGSSSTKSVKAYDVPGAPSALTSDDYSVGVGVGTTVSLKWSAPSGYTDTLIHSNTIWK